MISIKDKQDCCGCSACASICPKQCITMVADVEGFFYPTVNEKDCINCGLCEKVCNELHPYDMREPQMVLAAINKNEEVRLRSSSGGIFYLLAEQVIKEEGVVFGARFDENWQVVIDYAEDMKGVEAFMGSKYVQARVENAYKNVKRFLIQGRKVLFSGTPCQVAGLHKFLKKKYENLLTVDFVCHGTPSPKVWGMYVDEINKKNRCFNDIEFRNKDDGWKNFGLKVHYNKEGDTMSLFIPFVKDPYMNVFLKNVILRPSCYQCSARNGQSQSDITLADFWGINTISPEMDDDKGTSLVFLHTEKGKNELNLNGCKIYETTYDLAKLRNPACYKSPKVHPKRSYFFKHLGIVSLIKLMKECSKPTYEEKYRNFKKKIKKQIKNLLFLGGKTLGSNLSCNNENIRMLNNPSIISISFRSKVFGWKSYHVEFVIKSENESKQ